ncbi:hypothetical protein Cadr_000004962 [Camelus dromedarius]|uniref:Uncharacterized protein n=1 Tax=Camelus dromedarius TaxID=9838 RepID=A0A5N4EBN4_CAMDR|nr:hypothetical protein Cadr_000004962 [Camelus dromedarius]
MLRWSAWIGSIIPTKTVRPACQATMEELEPKDSPGVSHDRLRALSVFAPGHRHEQGLGVFDSIPETAFLSLAGADFLGSQRSPEIEDCPPPRNQFNCSVSKEAGPAHWSSKANKISGMGCKPRAKVWSYTREALHQLGGGGSRDTRLPSAGGSSVESGTWLQSGQQPECTPCPAYTPTWLWGCSPGVTQSSFRLGSRLGTRETQKLAPGFQRACSCFLPNPDFAPPSSPHLPKSCFGLLLEEKESYLEERRNCCSCLRVRWHEILGMASRAGLMYVERGGAGMGRSGWKQMLTCRLARSGTGLVEVSCSVSEDEVAKASRRLTVVVSFSSGREAWSLGASCTPSLGSGTVSQGPAGTNVKSGIWSLRLCFQEVLPPPFTGSILSTRTFLSSRLVTLGSGAGGGVFESMKHEHTQDDGDKAREGAHNVHGRHTVPLLEEDNGGGNHHCGEEHVVDGEHQGGVKNVQRPCQDEGQDVGERVPHNGHPLEEVFNGDAQALDGGHREGSDHRADDDVNEDVPLSVAWGDDEDEDEAEHQQKHGKHDVPFVGEREKDNLSSLVAAHQLPPASSRWQHLRWPGPSQTFHVVPTPPRAWSPPVSFILAAISMTVVIFPSSGACITITVLPATQITQPSFPSRFRLSPRKWEERMALRVDMEKGLEQPGQPQPSPQGEQVRTHNSHTRKLFWTPRKRRKGGREGKWTRQADPVSLKSPGERYQERGEVHHLSSKTTKTVPPIMPAHEHPVALAKAQPPGAWVTLAETLNLSWPQTFSLVAAEALPTGLRLACPFTDQSKRC